MIDDDLGISAAGTVARAGFERMVAEVCLGKVGAVAAREVSRFARNSRDWQQLIEMCRVVDTLLIDQETIYAPRQGNDRLLLGLKGSLNEYELDLLRQTSGPHPYQLRRMTSDPSPGTCRQLGPIRPATPASRNASSEPCCRRSLPISTRRSGRLSSRCTGPAVSTRSCGCRAAAVANVIVLRSKSLKRFVCWCELLMTI